MGNKLLVLNRFNNLLIFLTVIMLFFIIQYDSYSIPAFARKYKTSCATCHIAVSKRNAFGEAFRRNGYVMTKRNAKLIKDMPLKLGADAWKTMWPEAIWPSDIPGSFPVAAATQMRMQYNINKPPAGSQFEFNMPFDFSLLFGGAFGEDIGFFGSWSSVFGFSRMFFVFNDLVGPTDIFNVKVGYFPMGVSDGYPDNQRLTMERNNILGNSPAGDWRLFNPQAGLEINGIVSSRFQYNIGIVNGESNTRSDFNDNKDYYARIAYKIGGYGLDGEGLMMDSTQTNESWTDNSLTVGIYSYYGNTQKTESNVTFNNPFNRYGADIRFQEGELDLLVGAMTGTDERPQAANRKLNSLTGFLETDYLFYPWLIGIARFEYNETKSENVQQTASSSNQYYNIILNVCVLYRQNIRFSLESCINIKGDRVDASQNVPVDNTKPWQWVKLNSLFAF